MTDLLEEALAALRDEDAPEARSGEATLERIRRSLAASEDASARALEAALEPVADVAVLYGEDDRLLDLAVAALRAPEGAEPDGAATLERIRGSLAAREREGLVDLAAAEWREETAPAHHEPVRDADVKQATGRRVLATLDARRARARWALAAAAALALAVVPPTAWAWSTGRIERWITSIAAPSTIEQTSTPSRSDAPTLAPPRAPRVPRAEEHEAPAQESVIVASSEAPSAAPAEDERAHATRAPAPRRPARRAVASEAPPEPHRAEPLVMAEEPALPSPEASTPSPAGAEERELFARAHHLHFGGAPQSAALAAWDDYLSAYPRGHYAPEARYNRALTLVRLGRIEDARRVLARFAAAPAGAYRRDEARALLDAITANGATAE